MKQLTVAYWAAGCQELDGGTRAAALVGGCDFTDSDGAEYLCTFSARTVSTVVHLPALTHSVHVRRVGTVLQQSACTHSRPDSHSNQHRGVDPWVDRGTLPPTFWSGGDAVCFVPPTFSGVDIFVRCSKLFIGWLEQFSLNLVTGQLILMKIIETVATRCQILRLKCTKFNIGSSGSLQRSPNPLAELGATSMKRGKRREWRHGGVPLLFLWISAWSAGWCYYRQPIFSVILSQSIYISFCLSM